MCVYIYREREIWEHTATPKVKEAQTIVKVEKTRSGVVLVVSSLFTNNNPFSILLSPSIFFTQNPKNQDLRQIFRAGGKEKGIFVEIKNVLSPCLLI